MAVNAVSNAAQRVMGDIPTAQTRAHDEHARETMLALTWQGKHHVQLQEMPRPTVTDPQDVVIRTTASSVCGSDLHLYGGDILQLKAGDVLGHEGMGVVVEAGPEVKSVKVGDRVVLSFQCGCGTCTMCKEGLYSMCERTNSSSVMAGLYGSASRQTGKFAGLLGYGHFCGGMAGCQATYVRMPFADTNTLLIPEGVPDEKVFMLTDVACTSYHAVVDVGFEKGQSAAVWGAGPVGQLVAQWLQVFGARRIVLIDNVASRLEFAKRALNDGAVASAAGAQRTQIETLNFDDATECPDGLVNKLYDMESLGWDVCFDVAGFRYAKSMLHKAMRAVALETDTPETLNECILAVRKFGRISIPADYAGLANGVNLGAMMEKGVMLKGSGQAPVQKYFHKLLHEYVIPGKFDTTKVLTHRFDITEIEALYAAFNEKRFDEDKGTPILKCFVQTPASAPPAPGTPQLSKVVPGA